MTDNATKTEDDIQQPSAPSLLIADLTAVAQIIQISSTRGAFRAEELANVGTIYNKLIAFLDSVGAIAKPENATENENA